MTIVPDEKPSTDERLDRVEKRLDEILEIMGRTQVIVEKVAAEVMPTLQAALDSPMLKMLGMRKK